MAVDFSKFGVVASDEDASVYNPPRPTDPNEIQFETIYFDPVRGEGEWAIYRITDDVLEFYDYLEFERKVRELLRPSVHFSTNTMDFVLEYCQNFKVVNCDLSTGRIYVPYSEVVSEGTRKQVLQHNLRDAARGKHEEWFVTPKRRTV
jgi:hypothetical protein